MIKTAMSFALGCALLLQLADLPSIQFLWLCLPTLLLLRSATTRLLAMVLAGILWALFYSHLAVSDRLLAELIGKQLTIAGTIASVPDRTNHLIRFEFVPTQTPDVPLPSRLRLSWYSPLPEQLNAGETWQLTVKLKPPHGFSNPGGFDYEGWLFQQHIGATGYVRTSENNHKLADPSLFSINALRQKLAHKIKQLLADSDYYGLIQGLTTGIRFNISQQQWQTLRATGTSHLLAISGLHVGLAALLGFVCFRYLWSLRSANLLVLAANEAGAIAGCITALFYAALAGFSLPTQRALIMITTAMLMLLIRRPIASQRILALSLFLVLFWDPLSVLSAGFWLSFVAVAIILFVSQNRFPAANFQWLKIHFLIALGLSPLLLLFFLQTSLISPLANVIAVPFVSFIIVPVVLLASMMSFISDPLTTVLLQVADGLVGYSWPALNYLATLPFASWSSTNIAGFYWFAISVAILMLLMPKATPAKWLGLIGIIPLFLSDAEHPAENSFWFTLLDVGQGLSAVIQTQHHTLLFDAGAKFSANFDSGQSVVLPFLQHQGIKQVDKLIISHGDNDHKGGAHSVINGIKIVDIISSDTSLFTHAQACVAGQSWTWDGITFSILSPYPDDEGTANNLSCVLKVTATTGSVLLTADIEFETEQRLIKRNAQALKSTVLVAPHHGSKTSSSPQFIQQINPDYVLFPVGFANRYHFPAKAVVARYQQQDTIMANTAEHGAILFKFNQDEIKPMLVWRQHARKIWTHQSSATD